MVQVLRLTRWELFKLRKRWMPWILVAVAVAICQAFLWGSYYEYVIRVLTAYMVVAGVAADLPPVIVPGITSQFKPL